MGFMLPTTRAQVDELPDDANNGTVPNLSEIDVFGINPRANETPHEERLPVKAEEDVTSVTQVNRQPEATDIVPPADEPSQDEANFFFTDYDDESVYWG